MLYALANNTPRPNDDPTKSICSSNTNQTPKLTLIPAIIIAISVTITITITVVFPLVLILAGDQPQPISELRKGACWQERGQGETQTTAV